jgi:hypothetical protein
VNEIYSHEGSRDAVHEGWIEPEDLKGTFATQLRCTNPECGRQLAVAGKWRCIAEADYDNRALEYPDLLLVQYVSPPLRIITPPARTPQKVVDAIDAANSVIWINPSAAANQLRQAVEELLTHLKVVRTAVSKKGKRVRLSTHARIELYRAKNHEVAQALEAVKWIGNSGSHEGRLTIANVLEGADYLSLALRKLYDRTDATHLANAAKVNSRRGVPRTTSPARGTRRP